MASGTKGGVWDREVLGKNWFRYQTVGAAALQATFDVNDLSNNNERSSLFVENITKQLQNSVEQTSVELLQLIGSRMVWTMVMFCHK